MPYHFGRRQITYRALLDCLKERFNCAVSVADSGGIPDTDGSESGMLYLVEREHKGHAGFPRFAHVEVYHQDLNVLPDVLRSVCVQLDLDEDDVANGRPN